jgi:glycosyltransferase involved in cell wall biosynthesis
MDAAGCGGASVDPGGTAATKVSIVICTRNRCAVLDRCLSTVANIDQVERAEVLVVDNGSTDETAAVAERWALNVPSLRYVYEPRTGLSHARNTGVEQARGDVVAFIDDDVLVDQGWLDALLAAYRRWPDVAGVAGRVELSWPTGRPGWLPVRREVWYARFDRGVDPVRLAERDYPVGANMSVRRDIAVAVAGFDPALGYSGSRLLANEEREFFDRVRRQGQWLGYEPAALVVHVIEGARVTRRYLLRRLYAQGRSDVRVGTASIQGGRQLGVARDALSRALLRGLRSDIRRIIQSESREVDVVDILAGRAKRLGIAHAAIAALLSGQRSARRS